MKKLLTMLFAVALGLNLSSQTPYNPDSDGDSLIAYNDLLSFLPLFGQSFTPEELLVDGESITDLIGILQSQIDSVAAYSHDEFLTLALNDSLLTNYLVNLAADSEQGDSTLGAWVMQLSEILDSQQMQIDSLIEVSQQITNSAEAMMDSVTFLIASIQQPISGFQQLYEPDEPYQHGCELYLGGEEQVFVIPEGVTMVEVWATGAGGGAGGSATWSPGNWISAGPGGGGGMSVKFQLPVSPGDSLNIEVGLDGVNGSSGSPCSVAGSDGGETSVKINGSILLEITGASGGSACCYNSSCPQCPCGTPGNPGSAVLFNEIPSESVLNETCMGLHPYGLIDFDSGFHLSASQSQISIRW